MINCSITSIDELVGKAHEKNEHLANYDFLTGLPNRLKLMDSLQTMLATPKVTQFALLFLI